MAVLELNPRVLRIWYELYINVKGEESKLLKKAEAIRAAIEMLGGNSSGVEGNGRRKKWHMSAASKARISKAQKARWAAKRKAAKKNA